MNFIAPPTVACIFRIDYIYFVPKTYAPNDDTGQNDGVMPNMQMIQANLAQSLMLASPSPPPTTSSSRGKIGENSIPTAASVAMITAIFVHVVVVACLCYVRLANTTSIRFEFIMRWQWCNTAFCTMVRSCVPHKLSVYKHSSHLPRNSMQFYRRRKLIRMPHIMSACTRNVWMRARRSTSERNRGIYSPPSHCITSHGRNISEKSKKRKLETDLNVLLRVINRFIEDRIFVGGCRCETWHRRGAASRRKWEYRKKDLFIIMYRNGAHECLMWMCDAITIVEGKCGFLQEIVICFGLRAWQAIVMNSIRVPARSVRVWIVSLSHSAMASHHVIYVLCVVIWRCSSLNSIRESIIFHAVRLSRVIWDNFVADLV